MRDSSNRLGVVPVRRLIVISTAHAKGGWYPEVQEGMAAVGAAMAEAMLQTPTGRFSSSWPEPDRFPKFLDKMSKMMSDHSWRIHRLVPPSSAAVATRPLIVLPQARPRRSEGYARK